jgi:hypothetical protein
MAKTRVGVRNGGLIVPSSNIITDGLVLHLDAGNTSSYPGTGTIWNDLTGNGNNGTLTNGVTYLTDNGGIMSFDGINDYVNLGTPNDLNFGDNITISVWHKLITPSSLDVLFGNGSGSGGRGILSYNATTSKYSWYQNGSDYSPKSTDLTYSNNVWRNVTITRELGVGNWLIKFYVDGVLDSSKTTTTTIGVNSSTSIGKFGGFNGHYFKGQISNVIFYNRSIIDSEVLQNYNATKGRFGL